MFKATRTYGFGVVILLLVSCSQEMKKEPVARVGDKYLYHSDIAKILSQNTDKEDSVLLADDYINKWIKQELMIQKADEELATEQKNVEKELREYRNSLIIYKYKNELLKQRMDTVVTSSQIEEYYQSHPKDFNLDKNIVKSVFIKIPVDIAKPDIVKELVQNVSHDEGTELQEYCIQYAKKYDISITNWIDFEILLRNLPEQINDTQDFLRRNSMTELSDSNYYYIVSVHDFKLANDLAPIEFVESNIKNLILNQRKIKFLKEIEENIYTEGLRQKKFRIYKQKTNDQE